MRTLIFLALSTLGVLSACESLVGDPLDEDPDEMMPADDTIDQIEAAPPSTPVTTNGCKNTFDFEKEFVIRSLAVVDDPTRTTGTGVWTFGHLIAALSGTRDPKAVASEWLRTWETSPVLDGQVVQGARGKIDDLVIDPWEADGFALEKAPFRLNVIVLRPDTPNGPELRFVYSGVMPGPKRAAMPFNVAFEYSVTTAFEKKWFDTLKPLALGSAAYNTALASLTEEGIKDATKTNGSSLRQLRTNEVAIDTPWDLREFHLTATAGGTLARARLARQPRIEFNDTAKLSGGVTPEMETYMAIVPSEDFRWKVPGLTAQQRFEFAMTTCAGCHSKETNTAFTQIKPREAGKVAQLSSFLQSRTCAAGDTQCQRLEAKGEFNDPVYPSQRFRTQDDRMAALNAVLAAANDCEP